MKKTTTTKKPAFPGAAAPFTSAPAPKKKGTKGGKKGC